MKNLLLSFIGAALISGCSTCPPMPKEKSDTFAVQILSVEAPSPLETPFSIKDIWNNPEMRIYEFPTTYAEIGKLQQNDQSYHIDWPDELVGFDGKYTVPSQEKVYRSCEIQILNVVKKEITCLVAINHEEFIKFAPIMFEDGKERIVPHYEAWQICTETTQRLSDWNILTGYIADPEGNIIQSSHFFCVRIIPPKQKSDNDAFRAKPAQPSCRYHATSTIYMESDISPDKAITLAKKFVEKSQRDSLDVKSARVVGHTPYEWDVRFDDLKWKGTGILPNEGSVTIDKKTGKAEFQLLM
jgi:hypothetical protein